MLRLACSKESMLLSKEGTRDVEVEVFLRNLHC